MASDVPTRSSIQNFTNQELIALADLLVTDAARRIANYREQFEVAALVDGVQFAGEISSILTEALFNVPGPLLYVAERRLIDRMRYVTTG